MNSIVVRSSTNAVIAALTDGSIDRSTFSDVVVVGGNGKGGSGAQVRAHRVSLVAASPVLASIFRNQHPCANCNGEEVVLILPDFDSRTVRQVLRLMHCGKVTSPRLPELTRAIELADFLGIRDGVSFVFGGGGGGGGGVGKPTSERSTETTTINIDIGGGDTSKNDGGGESRCGSDQDEEIEICDETDASTHNYDGEGGTSCGEKTRPIKACGGEKSCSDNGLEHYGGEKSNSDSSPPRLLSDIELDDCSAKDTFGDGYIAGEIEIIDDDAVDGTSMLIGDVQIIENEIGVDENQAPIRSGNGDGDAVSSYYTSRMGKECNNRAGLLMINPLRNVTNLGAADLRNGVGGSLRLKLINRSEAKPRNENDQLFNKLLNGHVTQQPKTLGICELQNVNGREPEMNASIGDKDSGHEQVEMNTSMGDIGAQHEEMNTSGGNLDTQYEQEMNTSTDYDDTQYEIDYDSDYDQDGINDDGDYYDNDHEYNGEVNYDIESSYNKMSETVANETANAAKNTASDAISFLIDESTRFSAHSDLDLYLSSESENEDDCGGESESGRSLEAANSPLDGSSAIGEECISDMMQTESKSESPDVSVQIEIEEPDETCQQIRARNEVLRKDDICLKSETLSLSKSESKESGSVFDIGISVKENGTQQVVVLRDPINKRKLHVFPNERESHYFLSDQGNFPTQLTETSDWKLLNLPRVFLVRGSPLESGVFSSSSGQEVLTKFSSDEGQVQSEEVGLEGKPKVQMKQNAGRGLEQQQAEQVVVVKSKSVSFSEYKKCFAHNKSPYEHNRITNLGVRDNKGSQHEKQFFKTGDKENHAAIVHQGVRKYTCDSCDFVCVDMRALLCHQKMHNTVGEKRFKCSKCTYKSNNRETLKHHVKAHHNMPHLAKVLKTSAAKCKQRRQTTKTQNSVAAMTERSIDIQQNTKVVAQLRRQNAEQLEQKEEKLEEQAEDAFQGVGSKVSESALNKAAQLKQEYTKQIEQKEEKLDDRAEHAFQDGTGSNVNDSVLNKVYCSECKNWFVNKASLKSHVARIHRRVRDHQCTECEKAFFEVHGLNEHFARIHARIRNFPCISCNYAGVTKADLKKHDQRMHTAKSYDCDKCAYKTNYRGSLAKHLEAHDTQQGAENVTNMLPESESIC